MEETEHAGDKIDGKEKRRRKESESYITSNIRIYGYDAAI